MLSKTRPRTPRGPAPDLTGLRAAAYRTAMRVGALLAAGFGLLALAGTAAAAPPAQSTDPGERLDLSIRARGLGIAPVTPGADNLGLEAVKAPTGAGSLQMPR